MAGHNIMKFQQVNLSNSSEPMNSYHKKEEIQEQYPIKTAGKNWKAPQQKTSQFAPLDSCIITTKRYIEKDWNKPRREKEEPIWSS